MEAAPEQRVPRHTACGEQIRPEASYACASQSEGHADGDGHDQRATAEPNVLGRMPDRERQKPQDVGRDREEQQKRDRRMPSEDDSCDEIADGDISGERDRPADRQHRLVEYVDHAHVDHRGNNRGADRCNDRHQRAPPRMEHSVRRCRFDDLLGYQREEEHHRHVVDRERDRKGEAEVALRTRIGPYQGDQRAQGQQEQVLHSESGKARNGRPPAWIRRGVLLTWPGPAGGSRRSRRSYLCARSPGRTFLFRKFRRP